VALWTALTVALLLGLPCAAVRAEDKDSEAIAYQARGILRKHCSECHGAQQARAGLRILDHRELVGARTVVLPEAPSCSELLERIEDGSMPPGSRAKVPADDQAILRKWIESRAPFFPAEPSEQSVLSSILEDVKKIKEHDKDLASRPRYISLNHLLSGADPLAELEIYRKALAFAVGKLKEKKLPTDRPALVPIDPGGTIYRISLKELGWDEPIYETPLRADPLHVSIMDVILLAYPYGLGLRRAPVSVEFEREFLEPAHQIRPIAFLRGDWLVGAMLRQPEKNDLRVLPAYPDRNAPSMIAAADRYRAPVTMATALAELGPIVSADMVRQQGLTKLPALAPLGREDGTIPRAEWERLFQPLCQRLVIGQPIWAIDALPRPDLQAESLAEEVEFAVRDSTLKKDAMVFQPGQRRHVLVRNLSNRPLYIEVIQHSADKDAIVLDRKEDGRGEVILLPAGKEVRFPEGEEGSEVSDVVGEDRWTILVDERKFDPGVREALLDLPIPNRVVHPEIPGSIRQKSIVTMTKKP
jgi:mono/diheme cytochrome c family protein